MAYYDALKAKWPTVQGATTADKLAALNAETVVGPRAAVPITAVMGYLRTNNLWLPIKAAAGTSTGAAAAVDLNDDLRMENINFDLPIVRGMLANLVDHRLLAQPEADALIAMGDTTQPWWQANGYQRPINTGDVVVAGLDTTTGYAASVTSAATGFLVSVSIMVTGPRGSQTDTNSGASLDLDMAQKLAANAVQNMMQRDASLTTFG